MTIKVRLFENTDQGARERQNNLYDDPRMLLTYSVSNLKDAIGKSQPHMRLNTIGAF